MSLQHIAFIMDGNGRWAKKHGKPRFLGHEAGMNKIEEVCNWCKEYNIKYGSFFAFSKENWNRPKNEVDFIFSLIERYYQDQINKLMSNKIRFIHIGDKSTLPTKTNHILNELENITKENDTFNLLFFFNYSSREEINNAAIYFAQELSKKNIKDEDGNLTFSSFLLTANFPDPDLLIRTSGEMRISNFLLYQIAYTELYFEPQLWPEYTKSHFVKAIESFYKRDRRFGKIKE
ncbi:MAG: di-trans,poly-cis-decaprenylcistransferase [Spirochaetales bacterium]|nr:di-trans,poly-cis-decaprenylcistransferase [Spirochaetales bacterium]